MYSNNLQNFLIYWYLFKLEKEKKQELAVNWRKESSILASKLDDARLMIEALEKNKQLSLKELTSLNEEINKVSLILLC